MSPCTRRRFLRRGSLAVSLALAGCSGERERRGTTGATRTATPTTAPPEPTTSTPTTSEPPSSAPTTDEPTPNTPLPSAEQQYDFGDWHVAEPWKLTVAGMELSTTFRTDDGETYEMPDGEQLLVVTARVENVDTRRRGYSGALDGLIDDQVYEDDYTFEHPDYEHGIGLNELTQVEHVARYDPTLTRSIPARPAPRGSRGRFHGRSPGETFESGTTPTTMGRTRFAGFRRSRRAGGPYHAHSWVRQPS